MGLTPILYQKMKNFYAKAEYQRQQGHCAIIQHHHQDRCKRPSQMDVAPWCYMCSDGWMGWISAVEVGYRAHYGANNRYQNQQNIYKLT